MSQEWITDRLPTQADGDMDGDVYMRRAPGSDGARLIHWTFVWPGMDWLRTSFWQPPTEPAPTETTGIEPDRIAALEQRVAELEAALQRVPEAMVSGFQSMFKKAVS
jgi:hypothetical protein